MQCPCCANTALVMSERQGVEIDYCPKCRGVWLDRGELDKLIERSAQAGAAPAAPAAAPVPAPAPHGHAHGHHPYPSGHGYPPKRKYKSWLDEIFD